MKNKDKVQGYIDRMTLAWENYREAVLAHSRGQTYTSDDATVMEKMEKNFEFMGEAKAFRKALAEFYFALKRQSKPMKWDTHPVVKLGMLKYVGITEEYFDVLLGEKVLPSIDDPWDKT